VRCNKWRSGIRFSISKSGYLSLLSQTICTLVAIAGLDEDRPAINPVIEILREVTSGRMVSAVGLKQ
jgi:hypothetical protein